MFFQNRQAYYAALNQSNTAMDCTPFVELMLEMLLDALRDVLAGQKGISDRNSNEGKLLMMLSDAPEMTIIEMADTLGISPRQIQRILANLKEQGKLLREGSNKKGKWLVR